MDLDKSLSAESCGYTRSNGHGSRALVWAIFLLLAITTWARGGSSDITPWVQFVLATLVVVVYFWEVFSGDFKGLAGGIFRDPVLYLGLALLVLLGVQWANSGRELFYDSSLKTWLYSDAPNRMLPSAFSASEAKEVWIWFYCAVVIAVSIRSSLMSRRGIYRLWKLVLMNSCVLGVFGVIQFLSSTDRIFWVQHLPYQRFFASFGYSNHAGSFFLLMLFLAGSMLVRRVFRHQPARFTLKTSLLLAAILLYLLCANLTLSRYAILGSWVGVVVFSVYIVRRLWRKGTPALKLNLTILLICAGAVAIYASFSAAGAMLGKELSSFLRLQDDFLGGGRTIMSRAGLSVWSESPLFGVGPWGFRHLVGLHLDESVHFMLKPGSASLHNDALQYLVESGVVGLGLMAGVVGVLIYPIRLSILRNWMPGIILLVGVAAIALQSTFDLPMRNPAVFYCWLAIIVGVSKISSEKLYEEKALVKNEAPVSSDSVSEGDVKT